MNATKRKAKLKPPQPAFKIISRESQADLEEAINEQAAEGWMPSGGIHVQTWEHGPETYFQALIHTDWFTYALASAARAASKYA